MLCLRICHDFEVNCACCSRKRGAAYLVGHGHGFIHGIGEFEQLYVIMPGRDSFCALLVHADALDVISHTGLFQRWKIFSKLRFTDVKTHMMRFFQKSQSVATLGQQRWRLSSLRAHHLLPLRRNPKQGRSMPRRECSWFNLTCY
jgi:hypothetical protein